MKRISLCFLLVAAMQSFCHADVTKLSTELRKALQDLSRFHEVPTTTNLPSAVITLCADNNGKIAEPGQKWESTDVISDPTLPRKRLIWGAMDGENYVVHYERGGRGHSFHVLVATFKKGDTKPKKTWRGVGNRLKDYSAFLDSLQSGKLDDRLDYAH